MFLTVLIFLVVLSVLVLVHEFGHFVVGKFFGIGVEEFALGLPFTKPLWQKTLAGGMKLSFYPVLFGGFVKLLGEEGQESLAAKQTVRGKYFFQANPWVRMAIVVAGVVMNLFLAITVFYLYLFLSNFRVLIPRLAAYDFISPNKTLVAVTDVVKGSPGETAGLHPDDIILSADGREFSHLTDFQSYTKTRLGKEMKLTVTDVTLTAERVVTVVPRTNPPAGQGAIGVAITEGIELIYSTADQRRSSGLTYAVDTLVYNFKVLGHFAGAAFKTGNAEPLADSVSGPVGIASAIGDILKLSSKQAILQLLNLLGLLSLSLGFMNILPFPALDGGRLAFYLVEAITGKRLPSRYENLVNQAGLVILLGFMVLVTFNDVAKVILPLFKR